MNFQAALHDPSVRFLGGFILGALIVAGLALLLLKYALGKNVTSVWRIYQGWLIMIPTVLAAVLIGREATITLFSIVAFIGFREFARATGLYRDWWMTGAVYVSIGAIFLIAILTDPYNGPLGENNPATPAPAWCGDPQAYLKSVIDLAPYAGQNVRFRFRVTSDTSVGRAEGWNIDNVEIKRCN